MSSDLSTCYDDVSIKELLNVVTYLDPRYKSLPFKNAAEKAKILQDVKSMVMNHVSEAEERTELTSTTSPLETEPSGSEGPPTKKRKPGPLTKLLGDIFTQEKSCNNPTDHARNELVRYEAEEVLDLDSNPLKWWKERRKLFPILSDLSSKLFSLPATNVPSERIFSCAGNIITEKRNRLLSSNVDKLVFLFENQDN